MYRDLDVSIMNEMPASRLPIKNSDCGTSYRPAAWEFIRKQVALGHQAYVICPMIEENEKMVWKMWKSMQECFRRHYRLLLPLKL